MAEYARKIICRTVNAPILLLHPRSDKPFRRYQRKQSATYIPVTLAASLYCAEYLVNKPQTNNNPRVSPLNSSASAIRRIIPLPIHKPLT